MKDEGRKLTILMKTQLNCPPLETPRGEHPYFPTFIDGRAHDGVKGK